MPRTPNPDNDGERARPAKAGNWLRAALRTLFRRQPPKGRTAKTELTPAGQERAEAGAQGRTGGKVAAPSATSDQAMYIELTALFKGAPGSHDALRHLAAVRHGLKHKDPKGLFLFGA